MIKIITLILSILVFFFSENIFGQNPSSVDINHPIYAYLDRMETLDNITRVLDGVKPLSRTEIALRLRDISDKRSRLSEIDKRKLDDFLLDFRYEINITLKHDLITQGKNWYSTLSSWNNFKNDFLRVLERSYPEEENHVVLWEDSLNNFYFDFEQYFTFDRRSDDVSRNANQQSYIFRGLLDQNFSYQLKVSLQAVRGDADYRDLDPIIKNTFIPSTYGEEKAFVDRSGGELAWHTKFMNINFAQQEIAWGHGESGKLILSKFPEQYPYLQISKNWNWGKFTALHGKLQSFRRDTLTDGTPLYPDKWVAAHRLEFSPWDPLTIGLNEVFIYGQRYADWAYLIPFNFYRAVQHKLRDRDNATISLDFEYIPFVGSKLYTTIFLDEMRFEKLGTNWWANKQAIQVGLHQVDPFSLPNLEIRAEYSAIMPWVYTHKYQINRYESDGRSLGHWAGPNSEVFYAHIMKDFHARFKTGIKWMQYKKGQNRENENVGGDLLQSHNILIGTQKKPKETRTFLEGNLITERSTEFYVQYEIFNDLFLSFSYISIETKQKSAYKNLNEIHLGFLFNY